ncbi:MAG: hypothetical protein KDA25_07800 [Phycisphaerales bacterium]|nr:hypothetical protein [Phycisphaerales bacterium]
MNLSDILIFVLGVIVTIVTVSAVVVIGRSEAQDLADEREDRAPPSSSAAAS